MSLINLTLTLILACFIDKSNLLAINGEIHSNSTSYREPSSTEKKSVGAVYMWPEFFPLETLTENHIKEVHNSRRSTESNHTFEEQYRHPKFRMQTNELKDQVEDVQSDDIVESNVMLEEQFRNRKFSDEIQNEIFEEDIEVHSYQIHNSHVYTIIACLLAVLSVGVIFAVISWRSYIKTQFGTRHRLVPTDEFNFSDDDRIHL